MSLLRLTARSRPEYEYGYLLDMVAVDMAASVLALTEKPLRRRRREKVIRADLDRMYRRWTKTLGRRPELAPDGLRHLAWPTDLDRAARFTLLVDAAFMEPYGDLPKLSLAQVERLVALRQLAERLGMNPVDADRTMRAIASAERAVRADDGPNAGQRALNVVAEAGSAFARSVTTLPVVFKGRPSESSGGAPERLPDLSDVVTELVVLCVHTVIVDRGLRDDEESVSAVVELLAERRAEVVRDLEILASTGASKDELRHVQQRSDSIDRAIDWLIDADVCA